MYAPFPSLVLNFYLTLTVSQKPLNLSPALSSLLDGEATVPLPSPPPLSFVSPSGKCILIYGQMSRPQTVKRLWQYIREHDLQDPSDRRQIRCDDAMRAVFKQERVHMFTMTKILNQNLYSPDEQPICPQEVHITTSSRLLSLEQGLHAVYTLLSFTTFDSLFFVFFCALCIGKPGTNNLSVPSFLFCFINYPQKS